MKSILRKSRYCLFLTLLALVAGLIGPQPADAFRELSTFGAFGVNEGELQNPFGLAVDEVNGFIYVADTANHRIQVFSIYGDYISFFGSSGSGDGQFRHPQGVGVDASGNVYVVGTVNSRIQKFLCSGGSCTYDMQFGTKGSGNDQFYLPRDISLDSAGNIYVCDSGNDRILKFDPSGNWQATIGAGDIFNPYGIDVDDSGNIYVADTENHRIIKYDPSGTILMQFGSYGTGDGEFRHPHDVAVDGEGNIFVADTNNYRIQRFDPSGEYVYSIGRFVEYITPQKVVVDSSQRLYTIDSNTNRVRIYDVRDFFTNVYAEPTTFSPDGDGIHDVTNIHYTIPEPALITITIYDANNTLVRTLLSDIERVTPNNVEVWDGLKDDLVTYAEEGYYTCRLDARASGNYHPPQQRVEIRVHYPLGQISGSVTDGSDPLEGATVTAETHSILTDSFGDYTITDLPAYEYNVVASKAGCSEVARLVILDEDEVVTGIDFELGCYQVTGVVTDGTDSLEGVLVTAGNQSAFTDSAGQYTLENLLAGTHTLTAEKTGCIVAYQLIYVDRNQPITTADFTLDCTPQPDIRVYPESLSFTVIDSAESMESLPSSGSQSNDNYEINLKSRKFTPKEKEVAVKANKGKKEKFHAIVQFYQVPDKWERKELKKLGLKMLSYMPNNAWFSTIHTADLDALRNHPLIRWIGDLEPGDKLSPRIKNKGVPSWAKQKDGKVEVIVKFYKDVEVAEVDDQMTKVGGDIKERYKLTNAVRVVIPQEAIQTLTEEDIVQWIEEAPPPFRAFNDGSRVSVDAGAAQAAPYGLSGLGVVVGIWNGGHVDADHDDFTDRVTFGDNADIGSHATHVAGTMAGDGSLSWEKDGTPYQWRGMAPAAQILSYDWNNSTGEYSDAINIYNISISNNSWGYDIDEAKYDNCSLYGDYPTIVAEYDAIVRGGEGKPVMIVFAVGNDRNDLDCGFVSPDVGYGTVPPPATGKNLLTVGAVNSDTDSMTVFSAWGPVDDGRLKPDLVAPGCEEGGEGFIKSTLPGDQYGGPGYCGTSMAAPVVSGIAALIVERFKDNYGSEALPSTVKAYMIHTAVDLETPGPDYRTGYGKVNALAAIDAVDSFKFVEEQLENSGQEDTYLITVPEGAPELKVTLVWDDLPGVPNSPVELINDLDLVVTDPDGIIHAPWVLDPDNPSLAAGTGEDHLNTIEQVYVLNPIPGTWSVKIQGTFLAEPQSYSLVTKNIGTEEEGILTVYNDGTLDLQIYEISKTQDWLSVSPTDPLTISVDGSKVLNVSVSTKGLPSGTYTDNIKIESDDPDESTVLVPVSFTYIDTLAPIVSEVRSSVGGDTDDEYPVDSLVRIEVVEQDGEEELTGTITITGADDPGVAGEPLTDEGEGIYVYMWDTQGRLDGDYYVEVTLMDASGNEDSDGLSTTPDLAITLIDVIPPIVSITSPGDGDCINNTTVVVEGTVFDAASGVASVEVNGELASIDGEGFTAILTGLPDGPLPITATALDNAGNSSSFSINVSIDTEAPTGLAATPAGGSYCAIPVSLSASDGTIYYTTDGSEPTTESTEYMGPIDISEDTTLKFMAVDACGNQSSTVTEVYDIDTEAPTGLAATPAGGSYCATTVGLSASDGTIYYTIDGNEPTTESWVYTGPIDISGDTTVKFMAVDPCGNQSSTVTEVYDIDTEAPTGLAATPAGGSYCDVITGGYLTVSDGTIYFTIDGTEPTTDSFVYTGPGDITMSITLKFMAVDTCGNQSDTVTEIYDIDTEAVVTITSPVSGADDIYSGDLIVSGTADTDVSIIIVTSDQGHSELSNVDVNGNWSVLLTMVTAPSIVITAQGTDDCGHIGSDSVTVPVMRRIWYVNDNPPTNANTGMSWDEAFIDIQDAADIALRGDWIWVAEGTYTSDSTAPVLNMKDGVEIYGGFMGIETNFLQRVAPADHPTVLDGNNESNHVVIGASNAQLDGFIVMGGNADGGGNYNYGAGMYNNGVANLMVANCTFSGNSASGGIINYGGGMFNSESSLTVINTIFRGNSITRALAGYGGGMYNIESSPTIINSIFIGNSADALLGGCNSGFVCGGGMYNELNSSPTITNCVFSGNSTNQNGGGICNINNSSPTITNCIMWGDSPGEIYNSSSSPTVTYSDIEGGYLGEGNIDEDPRFVRYPDLHLQARSPCIDAGTETGAPSYDLDGNPRPSDEGYDMGAYEFQPVVAQWYVDADATGNNDGTSWVDAFTVIQNAVGAASSGDMIWVAEGTYTKPIGGNEAVLTMKDGVVIYGGFKGDEIDLSERITPTHYPTTLNGQDTSYHVVVGASNARLDGFIVTGGNASGSFPDNNGGGLYNVSVTNLVVANCTFTANLAEYGAGMYNSESSPTITNCIFSNNSAYYRGGGMYDYDSSSAIINCLFSGNSANDGGGIYNRGSSAEITNCTFFGNSAGLYGGGMYNWYSSPTITNCVFGGDTAGVSGSEEIYNYNASSDPFVTYSNVEGGYDGEGNIDTDPLFVTGSNGNYYLSHFDTHGESSPCIDAGSDTAANLGLDDRTTRTDGVTDTDKVDMGYHYNPLDTMRPCEPLPPGGRYCSPGVSVTLNCDDTEATIYYTLDGSEPTIESSIYTGPGYLTVDITLKFMAVDAYGNQSSTVIEVYDIDTEAPTGLAALPPGGRYCSPGVSVTLSCDDLDATIYYTLDGSEPTTGSLIYTGQIDISVDTTLKFMAVDTCGNQSSTVIEVYDIDTEAPTGLAATPAGGSYCDVITGGYLTVSDGTIYFTIDGTEPTTDSFVYTGPGDITMSITLKFMAVDTCGNQSDTVTEIYDIDTEAVVTITSPVSGADDIYSGDLIVSGTADTDVSIIIVTSDQGHSELSNVDVNGNWSVLLTMVTAPSIVITAQGTDDCGHIGSDSVTVPVMRRIWYVNDDPPTNANTGMSWDEAFTDIQDAVNIALSGDWIWVAEGIYGPIGWDEPVLTMKDGVEVFGGFVGVETGLSERGDPADHPTTLDGEGSDHVVVGASNARLDGFTVTGGDAYGGGSDEDGGGMYNNGVNYLIVANCIFRDNSAEDDGGGMHNTNSSLTITNCVFNNNSAMDNGGGMFNIESSPEITNCIFTGNSADGTSTDLGGGGIFNWWYSSPAIKNSIFTGNSAGYHGGGICNYDDSSPEIINCTFSGNSAGDSGGGMYNYNSSSPTITNCIMWGDSPGEIYNSSSSPTVTYSDIQRGYFPYPGEGNINFDPLFVIGPNGDYYLSHDGVDGQTINSPCIDAGSDLAANLGLDDKTTRTDGLTDTGMVDMGYHYITSRWAFFVTGTHQGDVYVFRSRRDGTFADKQIVGNVGAGCLGSAIADFDNDGDLDFVIQDKEGRSNLFINRSGLTMSFSHEIVAEGLSIGELVGYEAATADFDNDGYYDYIVPSLEGYFYLFLNTGQKTFSQSIVNAEWLSPEGWLAGIDAGDFNEDGNMDFLVVEYNSGCVYLYTGDGDGTFTYNLAFCNSNHGQGDTQAAVVGDFDNYGYLDAIVGQNDDGDPGQAWLYVGDGAGNFSYWGEAYDTNLSSEAVSYDKGGSGFADAYDFDEDGILDIVAFAYKFGLLFFKGNGDGTFQPSVKIDLYSSMTVGISAPPIP